MGNDNWLNKYSISKYGVVINPLSRVEESREIGISWWLSGLITKQACRAWNFINNRGRKYGEYLTDSYYSKFAHDFDCREFFLRQPGFHE
jgi:hypothetical protein